MNFSLRYHALHPEYIQERIKQLGYTYDLRVLLVQVDVVSPKFIENTKKKLSSILDLNLELQYYITKLHFISERSSPLIKGTWQNS